MFELLRLGHTTKRVSCALRRIRHPKLRETALFLIKPVEALTPLAPSQAQLPALLWSVMEPWVKTSKCVSLVPFAVK